LPLLWVSLIRRTLMNFRKNKNRQESGQGLVEFALALPIFLLAVFGVIELSRFFLVYSSVYTASREATRYGSSVDENNGTPHYLDCNGIRQAGMNVGFFAGLTASDIEIRYENSPSTANVSSNEKFDSLTRTCEAYNTAYLANPDRFFEINTGDRIVIRTIATYRPILGIIPEMPVQAINGRTIMLDLDIQGISPGRPNTPTPYYVVATPTSNVAPNVVILDEDLPDNDLLVLPDYTTRFKDINAVVTDFNPENRIHTWSLISGAEENISFSDTHTEDTTAEITSYGDFRVNLEVFDGQYTGSDTIWILANAKPTIVSVSASGEFISESGMICGSSDRLVLSGWASDLHGGVLSYEWDFNGPGTVSFFPNQTQQFPSITTFSEPGNYEFSLNVTDGYIAADPLYSVSVHVNALPEVIASVVTPLPAVQKFTPVQLTGTGTDYDGPEELTYRWIDVGNSGFVNFSNTNDVNTTASFSQGGLYRLQLAASDGCGEAFSNIVEVYVNMPPVVNAGADQVLPSSVLTATLNGLVTDDGFDITPPVYSWTQDSGPSAAVFSNPFGLNTQVTFTQSGTYVFRLTANDGWDIASDTVTIKNNTIPIAEAGADQNIRSTAFATLNGSFIDPDVPTSQSISYLWTKISGPGNVVFSNTASRNPTVTFSLSGEYVLQLQVYDGLDYGYDTVTIRKNILPFANAGSDQTVVRNTDVFLSGSASYDPDNIPNNGNLTYSWAVTPANSNVVFVTSNQSVNPTIRISSRGTYIIRLTVNDGWETTYDDVIITVTNN